MSHFFSPKEVASALGVSESSLKRWVDKGLIQAEKTGGGHRRLQLDSVLQFAREAGKSIANPELIGLPPGLGSTSLVSNGANAEFEQALAVGDELTARRVVLDLYMSNTSVANICDTVIAPSFQKIGDLWRSGDMEVYEERRACETCSRVIHELRRAVGTGKSDGPIAMGGTLDGDPYTLAACMSELVLRDCGWRANSLGNMLPFTTLRRAIERDRPRLMWLSVTSIKDLDQFIASFNVLFETATMFDSAIAVGGQALTADVRLRLRYTTYCDNFRHLEAFAKSLNPEH
jgi:excisionase family DNA binding protein